MYLREHERNLKRDVEQPMDFDMSIRRFSSRSDTGSFVPSFARLLRLHADLLLYSGQERRSIVYPDMTAEPSEMSAKDSVVGTVGRLANAIRRTASELLHHIDLVDGEAEVYKSH